MATRVYDRAMRPKPTKAIKRSPQPREAPKLPLAPEHLRQRPLSLPEDGPLPQIPLRSPTRHPFLYRKRLGTFDRRARHGDLVQLILGDGEVFGYGLFNPRAEMTVRLLSMGPEPPGQDWWSARLADSVALRRDTLQLDRVTNAYRIVHAEGDGLSGLVADLFGDVLSLEVFSLGMYQRIDALAPLLAELCGARHWIIRCAPQSLEHEGFHADPYGSPGHPAHTIIQENGAQFRVDFSEGHKTGFFCDQRDNRRRAAMLCTGKTVLDACCYSGGFAVQASLTGKAGEVTGVDLDEHAIATARANAKLNRTQIRFVHADVFPYMRDMQRNGRTYDVVILDPPKFIRSREEYDDGRQKYFDLNRLAMQLVAPGGWLVTCTCSGLLSVRDFQQTVSAAVPGARTARIIDRTGAAADHPVAANCLEGEYLQAIWMKLD